MIFRARIVGLILLAVAMVVSSRVSDVFLRIPPTVPPSRLHASPPRPATGVPDRRAAGRELGGDAERADKVDEFDAWICQTRIGNKRRHALQDEFTIAGLTH